MRRASIVSPTGRVACRHVRWQRILDTMKPISKARFQSLIREGRIEALTDLSRFGRVEIRWIRTGKIETVTLV